MKITAVVASLAAIAIATPTVNNVEKRQTSSGALPTVTVKGNAFFAGDERFYVRGVAYQFVPQNLPHKLFLHTDQHPDPVEQPTQQTLSSTFLTSHAM
tara:strand:- start:308 stop:601 length:294 start_codon:yes stop_codon:yes gene_type:complete